MDHKTLEYMEERVQKGKFLEKVLAGLKDGREMLDKENTEFLAITIGNRSARINLTDKVPHEVLFELLKDSLREGLDKVIAQVQAEYAEL